MCSFVFRDATLHELKHVETGTFLREDKKKGIIQVFIKRVDGGNAENHVKLLESIHTTAHPLDRSNSPTDDSELKIFIIIFHSHSTKYAKVKGVTETETTKFVDILINAHLRTVQSWRWQSETQNL